MSLPQALDGRAKLSWLSCSAVAFLAWPMLALSCVTNRMDSSAVQMTNPFYQEIFTHDFAMLFIIMQPQT